jgi:hypothetical protein
LNVVLNERFKQIVKDCRATHWLADWRSVLGESHGFFRATYGPHGEELLFAELDGYTLRMTKLTGDGNVPGGQVTFEAIGDARLVYFVGRQHLADDGFQRDWWIPALVERMYDDEQDAPQQQQQQQQQQHHHHHHQQQQTHKQPIYLVRSGLGDTLYIACSPEHAFRLWRERSATHRHASLLQLCDFPARAARLFEPFLDDAD